MAIAVVGSLGAATALTGSPAPAFGQATTAGNLLVCWLVTTSGATVSFSGTGWTLAGGTTNDNAQVWYKANCGAGETAPTVTTGTLGIAQLGEFSGADTTSPLETDSGTAATSASSPVADTCGAIDAATGNLVVAPMFDSLSKAGTDTTAISFTGGAATTVNGGQNDATSTTTHFRFAYGITTTKASADVATGTSASMNISNLAIKIASFKQQSTPAARVPRSPGIDSGNAHF